MRRVVFAAFALTVFAACQPATTELTDEMKAEIAAEVELIHAQMWDAWREVDVEKGMSYFYNSPTLTIAGEGELTTGFDTLRDIVHPSHAHMASQRITITESQTTVFALNVVSIVDKLTNVVTDTLGVTGTEAAYANSVIWVRQDGEWKIHFVHQSSPNTDRP